MISIVLVATDKRSIIKFIAEKKSSKNNLIFNIKPLKTEFGIDQIKEIIRGVKIYQPKPRTYVLEDFHLSSLEAQNAFLKLLEEPPEDTQFILVVNNVHQLAPTIISRSKIINLDKQKAQDVKEPIKKSLLNFLVKKSVIAISDELFMTNSKEVAVEILNNMIFFFRERLSSDKYAPVILKEILRIKQLLENNNLNPQLSIDHLLIFIKKAYNNYNGYKK